MALPGTVPSKRGVGTKEIMKASMLMKTVVALAVGAAFPLGAIAAQPAKTMTERGVVETVNSAGKEFALKGEHLKRAAIFEWNASTQFVENGKPAAASELKTGERATVNYAPHAEQRVAIRIAISPGARRLVLTRLRRTLTLRRGDRRGPGGCRSASGEKQIESIFFCPEGVCQGKSQS